MATTLSQDHPGSGVEYTLRMAHSEPLSPLAEALRERRRELGELTQAEAAVMMETHVPNVTRWEGRVHPKPEQFEAIAMFLGYPEVLDGRFANLIIRSELWHAGIRVGE
jgi:hypothetical protein